MISYIQSMNRRSAWNQVPYNRVFPLNILVISHTSSAVFVILQKECA